MTRRKSISLMLGAIVISAAAFAAKAEDTHAGYGNPVVTYQNQQQTTPVHGNHDQYYSLPNSYNGKYYPDDDTVIGYHGTQNSAQNSTGTTSAQTPYYYYY